MSFPTAAAFLAALPGQVRDVTKTTVALSTGVQGALGSGWTTAGLPGAGATPATGAGAVPTSSTPGAIQLWTPASGNQIYLARVVFNNQGTWGSVMLYDRLVHTSGLSGIVTTAQTVNTVALTRQTGGAGNMIWLEWYTTTGATASNVTASYTNQAGTSGRTTVSVPVPTSSVARQMLFLPLQAGDTGVRSVQSVTLSASTGTAGNFGVTLAHPVITLPNPNGGYLPVLEDALYTGLVTVDPQACLAFAGAGSFAGFCGSLSFVEGP